MYDVVVVGGGPAGLALSSALSTRGHAVALLERTTYDRFRPGETLDAETLPLLKSLGAWDTVGEFLDAQVPHRSVRSAWGSDELDDRPSILHPLGEGRHVQRARFDHLLGVWAKSTGVAMRENAGACVVTRHADGFRVVPARGAAVDGRTIVDASGRGAPASARLGGRHWIGIDRQVAIVAQMGVGGELGFDLLLESAEHGWWYSVPQADGRLIVALVTDADLGERAEWATRFSHAISSTTHTAARCNGVTPDAVRVVRADSGMLVPDGGDDWCAIGDAAMSTDPLAGNGVARALRSAIEAMPRIEARLAGQPRPDASRNHAFLDYLDRRAHYYELEARWPDAPFWARRRPGRWRGGADHVAADDDAASRRTNFASCARARRGAAPTAGHRVDPGAHPRTHAGACRAVDASRCGATRRPAIAGRRAAARRRRRADRRVTRYGICAARSTS